MTEQWYLDLDGVRSGPYQTSEVMSLIAEGEVLPHHQISSDLKGEHWMTLLEWRLQNGTPSEPAVKEPPPYIAPPPIEVQEPKPLPKVDVAPEPAPIPHFEPPPISEPSPKRDPMAEMFDMLQNTKHKREAKSQHAHAQAHAHSQTPAVPAPSSVSATSISKTIIVAGLITLVGFTMGQLFKKEPASVSKPKTEVSSNPSAPVAENTPSLPDEPPTVRSNELIDRSTDKITIRSKPLSENPPPSTPAPPTFTNKAESAEDIQELKELKKELMELKALKEEIKNSGDTELTPMDGAAPLMETYSDDPQGIKKVNPDAKVETKTDTAGETEIHY